MLSPLRKLLKLVHPEGIPWPVTLCYNALTKTGPFQRYYALVAQDIAAYCAEGSLLDIGTGPGWLLRTLHQQCPALKLTGVDTSAAMVTQARQNMAQAGLQDHIEVVEGNVSRLPFPDNAFDVVVSTGSIHHWKEPIAGLNEIYRVLKPGKYALIHDLVSDTPAAVLKEAAREYGRVRMFLLWLHAFEEPFYRHADFAALARQTLFKEGQTRFVSVLYCLCLKKE
jgi:ubiquinone/menaquinone biosynthesis C-methylase UbiE